jgi:hypothetical protein
MILDDMVGRTAESPGSNAAGQGVHTVLKPLAHRREAGTTIRTGATRWPVSLTAFSRTDRMVPDYGVHTGHLVGR